MEVAGEEEVEECIHNTTMAFNIPIYINGKTFTIPIDIKVGKNWEEMKKI